MLILELLKLGISYSDIKEMDIEEISMLLALHYAILEKQQQNMNNS